MSYSICRSRLDPIVAYDEIVDADVLQMQGNLQEASNQYLHAAFSDCVHVSLLAYHQLISISAQMNDSDSARYFERRVYDLANEMFQSEHPNCSHVCVMALQRIEDIYRQRQDDFSTYRFHIAAQRLTDFLTMTCSLTDNWTGAQSKRRGDYQSASDLFSRASKSSLSGIRFESLCNLGNLLRDLNFYDEAMACYLNAKQCAHRASSGAGTRKLNWFRAEILRARCAYEHPRLSAKTLAR